MVNVVSGSIIGSLLTEVCNIRRVVVNNDKLDTFGAPDESDEIFVTLSCRIDPIRYRSRETWSDNPGEAIQSNFGLVIYTQWTDLKITNDMRIEVIDDQVYDIVAMNPIRDMLGEGHHLEFEVRRGSNI